MSLLTTEPQLIELHKEVLPYFESYTSPTIHSILWDIIINRVYYGKQVCFDFLSTDPKTHQLRVIVMGSGWKPSLMFKTKDVETARLVVCTLNMKLFDIDTATQKRMVANCLMQAPRQPLKLSGTSVTIPINRDTQRETENEEPTMDPAGCRYMVSATVKGVYTDGTTGRQSEDVHSRFQSIPLSDWMKEEEVEDFLSNAHRQFLEETEYRRAIAEIFEKPADPTPTGALDKMIRQRAADRLNKDLYEIYAFLESNPLLKGLPIRNEMHCRITYNIKGAGSYEPAGAAALMLFNKNLAAYIEQETTNLLEDVASFKYYQTHPQED